ncbi:DNA-binding transcriptional regulator, LysR family [Arthrobacter crystallopoietes]|uniref:DNA-binding transcriptional regulator, LysR family n=2 Tax=Crystallibacter crystallopoietes TaxID=37928 RepID=A0A1H1C0P2_9MICC|nr:DNA-binding transcriptional regulator, LysR family [Arthrobacter crystallopoietes]
MREVADLLGTTTSTVSQQIALLARETGTVLLEPEGRGVRLTPAGRRLSEHAATILAAVEAARADLDPEAAPSGTLRVAGFATAIRRNIMPAVKEAAVSHPALRIAVQEHEPAEALEMLLADRTDLALTYDYNLAPELEDPRLDRLPLWSTAWGLGVPMDDQRSVKGSASEVFKAFRDRDWVGNSRNRADEVVVRSIGALAGFEPRLRHEADSLDLVEDLILAGMGVGLLPADRKPPSGVAVIPLAEPEVRLRAYAHTRKGRTTWPPLRYVLARLSSEQS